MNKRQHNTSAHTDKSDEEFNRTYLIYLTNINGDILYNVLLENSIMNVNNIICETLDVNNIVALFYITYYTMEEKIK